MMRPATWRAIPPPMAVHARPGFPGATENMATKRASKTAPGETPTAAPGTPRTAPPRTVWRSKIPAGRRGLLASIPHAGTGSPRAFYLARRKLAFACPMDRSSNAAQEVRCRTPIAVACVRRSARSMVARSATAAQLAPKVQGSVAVVPSFASARTAAGSIHRTRVQGTPRATPPVPVSFPTFAVATPAIREPAAAPQI
jgi:hypothetical protein